MSQICRILVYGSCLLSGLHGVQFIVSLQIMLPWLLYVWEGQYKPHCFKFPSSFFQDNFQWAKPNLTDIHIWMVMYLIQINTIIRLCNWKPNFSATSSDALSYLEDTSHASLAMSLAESSSKYRCVRIILSF